MVPWAFLICPDGHREPRRVEFALHIRADVSALMLQCDHGVWRPMLAYMHKRASRG